MNPGVRTALASPARRHLDDLVVGRVFGTAAYHKSIRPWLQAELRRAGHIERPLRGYVFDVYHAEGLLVVDRGAETARAAYLVGARVLAHDREPRVYRGPGLGIYDRRCELHPPRLAERARDVRLGLDREIYLAGIALARLHRAVLVEAGQIDDDLVLSVAEALRLGVAPAGLPENLPSESVRYVTSVAEPFMTATVAPETAAPSAFTTLPLIGLVAAPIASSPASMTEPAEPSPTTK